MASDDVLRQGVREGLGNWIKKLECNGDVEAQWKNKRRFIQKLKHSEIAIETDTANEQHYEVPTEFFQVVLDQKRLKYSCGYWKDDVNTLEQAQDAALAYVCDNARVQDGHFILDLGCGWGSLSLYILEKFPSAKVVCVSNSNTQRQLIQASADARGYSSRIECITEDANFFFTGYKFDRIISLEMFEHMKNYEKLMAKVVSWLKPSGLLFTQILCHREFPYSFVTKKGSDSEWMAQNFFSGGTMPSADLFMYFQNDAILVDHWKLNGSHYSKTLEAWLQRTDQNEDKVKQILGNAYGKDQAEQKLFNWRLFFIFCSEVFNYRNGNEWMVAFHLFKKRPTSNL